MGDVDHEIRLGDCIEGMRGLADGSVGCVITDPPYESEAHEKQSSARGKQGLERVGNSGPARLSFVAITEQLRADASAQMARLATRWAIVFCQAEAVSAWRESLTAAGLVYLRAAVWIKPDGMPQQSGDRPAQGYESLVCAHVPGRPRWNGGGKHGVYTFCKSDPERTGHPTQKPTALMEALVRDFTDPGELILDPFAGSGTTGVACKRLGRRFLGFERDEKFHAAAVKRLDATREQFDLPMRQPKAKQGALL